MMTLSKLGRLALGMVWVAAAASSGAAQSADAEVLTNAAIVQMVTGKLSRNLILTKITTARPGYDLSSNGLVYLTSNKIDESVIRAMIGAAQSAIQGGSAPASLAGVDEVLTNDAVVRMTMGKVSKKLIVSKILSSPTAFDVSAMGLVRLNEAKVPQDIIKTMLMPPVAVAAAVQPEAVKRAPDAKAVEATPASTTTSVKAAASLPVPVARKPKTVLPVAKIPTEPGIYVYASDGGSPQFHLLESIASSSQKTAGAIGSALSAGIAKVKIIAVFPGTESSVQTIDGSAEFYFVFEKKSPNAMNFLDNMGNASSPNEFSLVRMKVGSSGREVTVMAANAFGSQGGTAEKTNVPFKFTRVKVGVYRLVPTGVLEPGEYAFVPPSIGQSSGTASAQRLYDFGISK